MTHRLPDKMFFGKHQGKTVKEVILTDAQYILWLISKKNINFSEEVELFARLYAPTQRISFECDATEADIY